MCLINGLSRLDFHYVTQRHRLNFYNRLSISTNSFMNNLFWSCISKDMEADFIYRDYNGTCTPYWVTVDVHTVIFFLH
jgi:hypothetical protein